MSEVDESVLDLVSGLSTSKKPNDIVISVDSHKNIGYGTKTLIRFGAVSVLVFLSVAVLCIYYIMKEKKIMDDRIIPFIAEKKFWSWARDFFDKSEHRQLSVIYGTRGVGKTRSLGVLKNWANMESKLSITFDFKQISEYANSTEVDFFLFQSVLKGLMSFDTNMNHPTLPKSVVSILETYLSSFESDHCAVDIELKDSSIKIMYSIIHSILYGEELNPKQKSIVLFNVFELVSPYYRPLIFLHDPHIGLHFCCSTKNLIDELYALLIRRLSRGVNIGSVTEITESSDILRYNQYHFNVFHLQEFDFDSGKKTIVNRDKILTFFQYQQAYSYFGGIGQYYVFLFDSLRKGDGFPYAMSKIRNRVETRVIAVMKQAQQLMPKRTNILGKDLIVNSNDPYLGFLVQKSILSYYNASHLMISDEPTAKTLRKFFK